MKCVPLPHIVVIVCSTLERIKIIIVIRSSLKGIIIISVTLLKQKLFFFLKYYFIFCTALMKIPRDTSTIIISIGNTQFSLSWDQICYILGLFQAIRGLKNHVKGRKYANRWKKIYRFLVDFALKLQYILRCNDII